MEWTQDKKFILSPLEVKILELLSPTIGEEEPVQGRIGGTKQDWKILDAIYIILEEYCKTMRENNKELGYIEKGEIANKVAEILNRI